MIRGKKKPKIPDTAGGKTPDTIAKVLGELWNQSSRNLSWG